MQHLATSQKLCAHKHKQEQLLKFSKTAEEKLIFYKIFLY